MVDDSQATIAALKAQLSAAQAEAAKSAQALRHAEEDLSEHEAEEKRQHQSLRCALLLLGKQHPAELWCMR